MIRAAATANAAALSTTPVYTTLADSTADGALVGGITSAQALALSVSDPARLLDYLNPRMLAAVNALPHGTRLEFDVTGWTVAGASMAGLVANRVNAAFLGGTLVNPSTNTPLEAWPEYARQVAFASGDTVTFRVLASPWAWILVGVVGLLAVAVVWDLLAHSSWTASSVGIGSAVSPIGVLQWLVRYWYVPAGALVAGVLAPIIIADVANTRESENRLRYAEGGGY